MVLSPCVSQLAVQLKEARVNTATLELPYHLQRRPRTDRLTFYLHDLPSMLQATQQAIADTRALCRWLGEQGLHRHCLWDSTWACWLACGSN